MLSECGGPGFPWWVGALVAVAFVWWRTRARRVLRPAVLVGIAGGARGLPTTLFFDTQGQLVASHVGELTIASLKDAIGRHFGQSLQSGTER